MLDEPPQVATTRGSMIPKELSTVAAPSMATAHASTMQRGHLQDVRKHQVGQLAFMIRKADLSAVRSRADKRRMSSNLNIENGAVRILLSQLAFGVGLAGSVMNDVSDYATALGFDSEYIGLRSHRFLHFLTTQQIFNRETAIKLHHSFVIKYGTVNSVRQIADQNALLNRDGIDATHSASTTLSKISPASFSTSLCQFSFSYNTEKKKSRNKKSATCSSYKTPVGYPAAELFL